MTKPRKQIDELVVRYRLEPMLRDIYVEGVSDVVFVRRFVEANRLANVSVYEISTVEIPNEKVQEIGEPSGNRGQAIYLAHQLEALGNTNSATVIVDRDYDEVLDKIYPYKILLLTDFTCLEMYAFNKGTLDLVLLAIAPGFSKNSAQVLADVEPILRSLFAIRCTSLKLGLNLQWLDCDDCLDVKSGLRFDEDEFVHRYLNKNAALSERFRFTATFTEIKAKLNPESRLCINGHDFVHVLSWYVRRHSGKHSALYRVEVLEKLVMSYVDIPSVAEMAMFRRLVERLTTQRSVEKDPSG